MCARTRSPARQRLYLLARVLVARHYRRRADARRRSPARSRARRASCSAPTRSSADASFSEDLLARRMAAAAELLVEQRSIPVSDVARLVGYRQAAPTSRAPSAAATGSRRRAFASERGGGAQPRSRGIEPRPGGVRRRPGRRGGRGRAPRRLPRLPRGACHRDGLRAGQAQAHQRARRRGRPRRRRSPPCCSHHLAHDRQAQPRAGPPAAPRRRGRSGRRCGGGPPRRSRARGRARSARRSRPARPRHRLTGRAVLDGVVDQVVDRAPQARGHAGDDRRLQLGSQRRSRARPLRARSSDLLARRWSRRTSSVSACGSLPAGEVDQVVDQQRQLLDLLHHVRRAALALVGVRMSGACWRISMLVRRLVTGVRSSCEASATSWRWACTDASSARIECSRASSIALKLPASRPISSARAPPCRRPVPRCAGRDPWFARRARRRGSAAPREHRRVRDQPPEQRGQGDAPERDQREDQAQSAQQVVDFGERLGELEGESRAPGSRGRSPSVRMRRWMPPLRALQERAAPLAASARVAALDRQCDARRAE